MFNFLQRKYNTVTPHQRTKKKSKLPVQHLESAWAFKFSKIVSISPFNSCWSGSQMVPTARAPRVPRAPGKMTKFKFFPKLLPEIKHIIWDIAVNSFGPQVLTVDLCRESCHTPRNCCCYHINYKVYPILHVSMDAKIYQLLGICIRDHSSSISRRMFSVSKIPLTTEWKLY